MTPELTAVTLVAILQVQQGGSMAAPASIEIRRDKTVSRRNRDRLGGNIEYKLGTRAAYSRGIGDF